MKTKSLSIVLISIIAMLISCNKETIETTANNNKANRKEILEFSSFDEYKAAIEKTYRMSSDELKEYEESIGFKSFGRMCDEIYFSINPDEFSSIDDVNQWVLSNSEFITLHTDMAGDTYCLPQEFDSKERFILNKDRMYIIGNHAYKRVDNAIVFADRDNIAKLKAINSLDDVENDVEIKKAPIPSSRELVDGGSLITKREQYSDEDPTGSYNLKLFIQTEIYHYSLPWKWETWRETEYKITNHKKNLGVWFLWKSKTDYEINLYSYDAKSGIERQVTASSGTNNIEHTFKYSDKKYIADGLTWDYKPYFSGYYATATNSAGCSVTLEPF